MSPRVGTRAHTVPKFYLKGFTFSPLTTRHDPCVWVASLNTSEIKQRSPKNLSIARGMYDGPGGFDNLNKTIENHLAELESAAAPAIRKLAECPMGTSPPIAPEITRFLAWQAARTIPFRKAMEKWVNESPFEGERKYIEPPPPGFKDIRDRIRPTLLENPTTGEQNEVLGLKSVDEHRRKGWRVVLRRDDYLELMHLQAWYFQVRHFPRLLWTRLKPPSGEFFITSDRAIAWLADNSSGASPAALKRPSTVVVAPLTKKLALVGRHEIGEFIITPREVNRLITFLASEWIASPTRRVVEQALSDHQIFSIPESEALFTLATLEKGASLINQSLRCFGGLP